MLNESDVSQRQIANDIQISEVTFSRWISGKREPSLFQVAFICRTLGYNLDWLLYGRGEKKGVPTAFAGTPKNYEEPQPEPLQVNDTGALQARLYDLVYRIAKLPERDQEKLIHLIEIQLDLIKRK